MCGSSNIVRPCENSQAAGVRGSTCVVPSRGGPCLRFAVGGLCCFGNIVFSGFMTVRTKTWEVFDFVCTLFLYTWNLHVHNCRENFTNKSL